MFVYKTTNKINGKIYIGQTTKSEKINYLGSGPIILKAFKKYGKENFTREILEYANTKEELNEKEKYWILVFNSTDRNVGYNLSFGGNGGNLGPVVNKKLSESAKLHSNRYHFPLGNIPYNKGGKMSDAQKIKMKKPKTAEHRKNLSLSKIGKNTKPVICLNNGITYNSIKEAAEKLNLSCPGIVNVAKKNIKDIKGFIFEYII